MSRKQKSTALAVVKKTEVLKISTSPRAQREQRGQSLAKDFVKFIGDMVPRIIQTRQDFLDREPDETICGVTTFRDYCTGVLDYSHSHIRNLIAGQTPASGKYSSKKPTQVTADEFANYEKTPEGEKIRQTAINLLKKMEPSDVVGALTGEMFGFPKPMAEAAVQVVTGQPLATKEEPVLVDEPAPAPLTVQELMKWADSQDNEDFHIERRRGPAKGSVYLSFSMLEPTTAKSLVEFYLRLKKDENDNAFLDSLENVG